MTAAAWKQARNILCVRLDTLGDVLMTTPAIRALKQDHSQRRVTLLTSAPGAVIAPLVSAIDQVITYDAPWLKATVPRASSAPDYAQIERLRQANYDAAVIFTVYSQNPLPAAFLCYMADIPLRLAHCHENPYQLLTDWVKDPEPQTLVRHEVQRQLDLVAQVGAELGDPRLRIEVSAEARSRLAQRLQRLPFDREQPWVVMHPGATAASRRYPPERFAQVAQLLRKQGIEAILTGVEAERSLINQIQAEFSNPLPSLVGKLDLAEIAALLELAPLLIANNTGPVHIAAAVGTPVVDLYALTNPQHTPWGVPSRVLYADVPCRFCYRSVCPEGHHRCLRAITPQQVVEAALSLLSLPTAEVTATDPCWQQPIPLTVC